MMHDTLKSYSTERLFDVRLKMMHHGLDPDGRPASADSMRTIEEELVARSVLTPTSLHELSEGFESLRQNDLKAAEPHFRRVLEISPGCVDAYASLGEVLLDFGTYDETSYEEAFYLLSQGKKLGTTFDLAKNYAMALRMRGGCTRELLNEIAFMLSEGLFCIQSGLRINEDCGYEQRDWHIRELSVNIMRIAIDTLRVFGHTNVREEPALAHLQHNMAKRPLTPENSRRSLYEAFTSLLNVLSNLFRRACDGEYPHDEAEKLAAWLSDDCYARGTHNADLEFLGYTALTLRARLLPGFAVLWFRRLCVLADKFSDVSNNTSVDYYRLSECEHVLGNEKKSLEALGMSHTICNNDKLLKLIERAYKERIYEID